MTSAARCYTGHTEMLGMARIVGMQFQHSKSDLIHIQKRGNCQPPLQLGGSEIAPVDSVRLLDIWLDKVDIRALRGRLESQMLALTHIGVGLRPGASTSLHTPVIRPAITYGAGVLAEQSPRDMSRALASSQDKALRKVAGGYKASPIRYRRRWRSSPELVHGSEETRLGATPGSIGVERTSTAQADKLPAPSPRTPTLLTSDWPPNAALEEVLHQKCVASMPDARICRSWPP